MPEVPERRSSVTSLSWWHWTVVLGLGVIVTLLTVTVIHIRSHPTSGNMEVQQVVTKVSRHVDLPTDETPALATVTDPGKLKNNVFLGQGRQGDRILIYAKWKRAVLYRPSTDRIIDIGPVNVSPPGGDTNGFTPLGK